MLSNLPGCSIYCIIDIDKERVLLGGKKGISVINLSSLKIEETIEKVDYEDIKRVYSFMKLKDGNILIGSGDGQLFIYDIKTKTINIKKQST